MNEILAIVGAIGLVALIVLAFAVRDVVRRDVGPRYEEEETD